MKRLIWYVHFHKAGGSSLVRLAKENGEILYPHHGNGNPLRSDGKDIRTWELSPGGLHDFVDSAIRNGVSFVASEWGVPNLEELEQRDDVTTVTLLREPVGRMISNFKFDFYRPFESSRSRIEDYTDHYLIPWTHSNYYARTLLSEAWREDGDQNVLQDAAFERLTHIDVVAPLEARDAYARISDTVGWASREARTVNSSGMSPRLRLRMLRKRLAEGRLDLVPRALQTPRVSEAMRGRLVHENAIDIGVYDRVRREWERQSKQDRKT